ncbi:MAG TPA: RsmE family RNA methyltransferase [Candidatus Eisenbacteria bacterium]|nr:RsmE family RNA methyltransferase [Candidatus Eisenbacteria bacterium]
MPADGARSAAPSFLYVPGLPAPGGRVTLPPEEARYLARVVRARPGDTVTATDGNGALATLRLGDARDCSDAVVQGVTHEVRSREAVLLAGAPEGERGDWLIEKLAELGVAALQPVEAERGGWEALGRRAARWERIAIAALRQSRRAHRLAILPPQDLAAALAEVRAGARFLADAQGPWAPAVAAGAGETALAVGPAAGFTASERKQLADAGFRPVRLADARLRTETACLALAAWWAAAGGSSGAAS